MAPASSVKNFSTGGKSMYSPRSRACRCALPFCASCARWAFVMSLADMVIPPLHVEDQAGVQTPSMTRCSLWVLCGSPRMRPFKTKVTALKRRQAVGPASSISSNEGVSHSVTTSGMRWTFRTPVRKISRMAWSARPDRHYRPRGLGGTNPALGTGTCALRGCL